MKAYARLQRVKKKRANSARSFITTQNPIRQLGFYSLFIKKWLGIIQTTLNNQKTLLSDSAAQLITSSCAYCYEQAA